MPIIISIASHETPTKIMTHRTLITGTQQNQFVKEVCVLLFGKWRAWVGWGWVAGWVGGWVCGWGCGLPEELDHQSNLNI